MLNNSLEECTRAEAATCLADLAAKVLAHGTYGDQPELSACIFQAGEAALAGDGA
jgi:hypothetical protein